MRIESLHKEIAECEATIREKMHYTRRLDHMLTRLKTNQVLQVIKNENEFTPLELGIEFFYFSFLINILMITTFSYIKWVLRGS